MTTDPANCRMDDCQTPISGDVGLGKSCFADDSIQTARVCRHEAGGLQQGAEQSGRVGGQFQQQNNSEQSLFFVC